MDEILIPDPSRYTFLKSMQRALGRPALWITTAFVTSLLALVAALPWLAWFREALEHAYEPGSLLRNLDEAFRFDHRASRGTLEEGTRGAGAVLAFLALLFGAFSAGGWLQVLLQRTGGHSLRSFFYGGSRYFFRFLRVLVLTLLSLQLASFVVYGLPWEKLVHGLLLGVRDLEELSSERTARQVVLLQDGLFFLSVALILVWGDYTRARMALHDGVSAVWAGICTWTSIVAHPLRTLRPMFFLWVLEAVVLWGAWILGGVFEARLQGPGDWLPLLLLFALGQLVLLWRCIVRGARYGAALEISGEIVRMPRRPDPWKASVGGPGGPQYPIGGDEYAVSL